MRPSNASRLSGDARPSFTVSAGTSSRRCKKRGKLWTDTRASI
jgi:hypothetical protein